MHRSIALLALFVAVAVNADGLLSFVPRNFHSQMPASARKDLASLSVKDFKALAQVARHASQFTSYAQMHQAVQHASPQFVVLANKRAQQAKTTLCSIQSSIVALIQKLLWTAQPSCQAIRQPSCSTLEEARRTYQEQLG
ncbi:hypothetical protein M3Y94_01115100 [Aphelenchoides besseyi]|nr:hypothetical protein M3Y94_01115100 [Aphelenchoides besseyi]